MAPRRGTFTSFSTRKLPKSPAGFRGRSWKRAIDSEIEGSLTRRMAATCRLPGFRDQKGHEARTDGSISNRLESNLCRSFSETTEKGARRGLGLGSAPAIRLKIWPHKRYTHWDPTLSSCKAPNRVATTERLAAVASSLNFNIFQWFPPDVSRSITSPDLPTTRSGLPTWPDLSRTPKMYHFEVHFQSSRRRNNNIHSPACSRTPYRAFWTAWRRVPHLLTSCCRRTQVSQQTWTVGA